MRSRKTTTQKFFSSDFFPSRIGKHFLLFSNARCFFWSLLLAKTFASSSFISHFKSPLPPRQADQICYAVLCVFSYMAAGQERQQHHATVRRGGSGGPGQGGGGQHQHASQHHHNISSSGSQSLSAGGLSPRGPSAGGLASSRAPTHNFAEPTQKNIVGQT